MLCQRAQLLLVRVNRYREWHASLSELVLMIFEETTMTDSARCKPPHTFFSRVAHLAPVHYVCQSSYAIRKFFVSRLEWLRPSTPAAAPSLHPKAQTGKEQRAVSPPLLPLQ